MNIFAFLVTFCFGFAGGVLSIKQVSDRRKWTLFVVFSVLGFIAGLVAPPVGNPFYFYAGLTFSGGAVASRYISEIPDAIQKWQARRRLRASVREIMEEHYGSASFLEG